MKLIFSLLLALGTFAGPSALAAEKIRFTLSHTVFVDSYPRITYEEQKVGGVFEPKANGGKMAVINVPLSFERPDTHETVQATFTLFLNHTFAVPDGEEVYSVRSWIEGDEKNVSTSPESYVRLRNFESFLATLNETEWRNQRNEKGRKVRITLRTEVKDFQIEQD